MQTDTAQEVGEARIVADTIKGWIHCENGHVSGTQFVSSLKELESLVLFAETGINPGNTVEVDIILRGPRDEFPRDL